CVYGIVRHVRDFSSSYSGARRIALEQCECVPGSQESRPCGDCGEQARTCTDDCVWSSWSDCEGPSPRGEEAECVAEGELGACANGRLYCVAGWLSCEPSEPSSEVCNGVDDDCDGLVDNGSSEEMGEGSPCEAEEGEGSTRCVEGRLECVAGDEPAEDPPEVGPEGEVYVFAEGMGCGPTRSGEPLFSLLLLAGFIAAIRSRAFGIALRAPR
ncbi:MAG: hypothetical protein ACOC0J_02740, partial [Myxococcota bacterium]